MKIELPKVISELPSTQPTGTTLLAANPARTDVIITANTPTKYYIKRGPAASATNYTWQLVTAGQSITVENYYGIFTVSPAPVAGDINVAEGLDKV